MSADPLPAPGDLPQDPLAVLPQDLGALLASFQQTNHPTPFPKTATVEGEFPEWVTVFQHYYKLSFGRCVVLAYTCLARDREGKEKAL